MNPAFCLHCGGPCTVREIYCAKCWRALQTKHSLP